MSRAAPNRNGRLARFVLSISRDKADTLLLLASALLVLAPHVGHLPWWVSAVCGATLAWRASITLRGTRMPPTLLLLPVALAAMAGVYATFHTLFGRDAGVAMLVLLVAFKMLEMHARRDLFVVIFLCFFLVLTNFFYSQSIVTGLAMLVSIVLLLTAQLSFQFTGAVPPLRRRLWLGARILALGAPLAMAMFVLFPRIQGPLWGLPGDAAAGRTGLSSSMAPGSLSNLALSEETAFRVRFLDPVPGQAALYWRAIVLGAYDGRTWNQVPTRRGEAPRLALTANGKPVRYQVTLEPSSSRWLFALELPQQVPQLPGNTVRVSSEFELKASFPIEQRVRYDAASFLDFSFQPDAPLEHAALWLQLPSNANPLTVAAGQRLRAEPDPVKRINAVLRQFRQDRYVYTLEPPLLGRHSVDEFLYQTKAGFCEHYAGAFVFLMRAAGVPARVITGYQGGELNPVDGYLTVRQSDAHAWSEVWLAGRGWVRVDPTAAVAPERVQRNLARALPRKPPFGFEGLGQLMDFETNPSSLLAQLRFRLNALDNGWNQWVLNYTPERQRGLLDALQDELMDPRGIATIALGMLLLMLARSLQRRRQRDPIDALYGALCQQLGRQGMPRAPDEGPSGYAQRLATLALAAPRKAAAIRFLQLYSAHKYAAPAPDARLAATLKHLLDESK